MQPVTKLTSNNQQLQDLKLPNSTHELIEIFETANSHLYRICAIAQIKHQILCSLQQQPRTLPSPQICQQIQSLFSNSLLRFLRKNRVATEEARAESKLFFHVVTLSIKYYYSEEGFRHLLANVTDLIDRHSYRVLPSLQFFTEIISTIQYSFNEENPKAQRCSFERHLTNQHINSMLTLANFCIERGVLPENTNLEDGQPEQHLKLITPEETLTAAIRLVRVCLCFDWQGEKYNQLEQVAEMGSLVIPTKRIRQVSQSEFEKWLRSSQWIWVYQFLFKTGQSVELRVELAGLVGDLARVHMKFFKNKANYRTHLQNIVYCFSKMLDNLEIYRNSQETIQVALAVLFNLNKVLSGSMNSMFFEINQNFGRGLLQVLKKFIVYQIIGEEIFNVNLIFFSFSFLSGVLKRSRYQQNPVHFELVQEVLRDVCRSYQQYLRILLNKIRKAPIRVSEASYYRLDYAQLRDSLNSYGWKQLQVYFMPFKLMKPRYANANTIYQFFVYICARVCRAVSLLEMFKLQKWEKQVAYSMLSQSVAKLGERFAFTSYKKTRPQPRDSPQDDFCPLPPISQHYEEQIQNQEEYCHMLRLTVFLVMEQLSNLSTEGAMKISSSIVRIVSLAVQLCLCADLQEDNSQELKEASCRQQLQEAFQLLPLLLKKAYLREYERALWQLGPNLRKVAPIHIHYSFQDYEFVDLQLETEAADLLVLLSRVNWQGLPNVFGILGQLRLLTAICLQSQWPSIPEDCLPSVESCLQALEVILSSEVLTNLIRYRQPRILSFLLRMVRMFQRIDYKQQNLASILRVLRMLAELRAFQVSQEALNKMFVLLKCLLPFLAQTHLSEQLVQECQLLYKGVLGGSQEADLLQLGEELHKLLVHNQERQPMDLETTCLSVPGNPKQLIQEVQEPNTNNNRVGEQEGGLLIDDSRVDENSQVNIGLIHDSGSKRGLSQKEPIVGHPKEQIIYSGYHRNKTMSLLNKYMQDQKQIPTHHHSKLGSFTHQNDVRSKTAQNNEANIPLSELDSKFLEEPMEIEYSHREHISEVCQPLEGSEGAKEANNVYLKTQDLGDQTIVQQNAEEQTQQEQDLTSRQQETKQTTQDKIAQDGISSVEGLPSIPCEPIQQQCKGRYLLQDTDKLAALQQTTVDSCQERKQVFWQSPDPEKSTSHPPSAQAQAEIAFSVRKKSEEQEKDSEVTGLVTESPQRNLLFISSSSSETNRSPAQ